MKKISFLLSIALLSIGSFAFGDFDYIQAKIFAQEEGFKKLSSAYSKKDLQQMFLESIHREDVPTMTELLKLKEIDPNGENTLYPPLYKAVISGNISMIKALLEGGANIQVKIGYDKKTIMHYATRHTRIMKYLYGCDPSLASAEDAHGETPLTDAILYSNVTAVDFLCGVDRELAKRRTKRRNLTDDTPLLSVAKIAYRPEATRIAAILINNGASVSNEQIEYINRTKGSCSDHQNYRRAEELASFLQKHIDKRNERLNQDFLSGEKPFELCSKEKSADDCMKLYAALVEARTNQELENNSWFKRSADGTDYTKLWPKSSPPQAD